MQATSAKKEDVDSNGNKNSSSSHSEGRGGFCSNLLDKQKMFKNYMEKKLHSSAYGSYLFQLVAILAAATTIASAAITYTASPFEYETQWFTTLDWFVCLAFFALWLLKLYVTPYPLHFLYQVDNSVLDIMVFLPVLVFRDPDPLNEYSYSFIIISRYLRIIIFTNALTKYYKLADTDV